MKKSVKVIGVLLCAIMLMMPFGVLAAGTTALSVSNNNPAQGDTFTVTATATESGSMVVKYNSSVLSVAGCDAAGFTQSDGVVNFNGTRGTITFKANNAGGSAISVSSSNASSSSIVVTVGAPAAAASEDFTLDGVKYTVSEKFSQEEIPEGFTQTQFQIAGKDLKGVTNGTMYLVYLKPVDNVAGQGKFYIYDQVTHQVSDYFFLGRPDYYLIPSEPSELINEALRKGQITVENQTVEVYTLQGIEDFVYVYGKCSDGSTGWFEYDVAGNTVQRINEAIFNNVSSSSASGVDAAALLDKVKSINIRYIIAGIIFVAIVIVVIIINIVLKKKDDKADLIDGSEDYVDVNDKNLSKEEKKRAKAEAKAAAKAAKEEEKQAKADEKAAKKEARRRKKEGLIDEEEYLNEIYDEYDDFDIDRGGEAANAAKGAGSVAGSEALTKDDDDNSGFEEVGVVSLSDVLAKEADDDAASDKSKVSEAADDDAASNKSKVSEATDDDVASNKSKVTEEPEDIEKTKVIDISKELGKMEAEPKEEKVEEDDDSDIAFWEDKKSTEKALKKRQKEEKKKNIFGDDELDLTKETPKVKNRKKSSKSGSSSNSDIIDFNDL
ncbi:MAG: hypothetical protein K5644_02695 [Lachnospiraceae bacterium]|nr:hypothetical protein [Lachnospiraceae bacterium]